MHNTQNHTTKHLRGTNIWNTYHSMKQRCLNKRNPSYKDYGGRGIFICDRWLESIFNFIEDMGELPSPSHSIGRIENDGGYHPGNCQWETPSQQANNRRKAPPRKSHPNSIANLQKMTTAKMREIWSGVRSNQKAKPKTCEVCNESFYRRGNPKGNHIYCSRKCYGESVKIRRANGNK